MKRIIASLVVGVSALSGQAFALVGGPFDNGSHSAALDRNAIYQGVLKFKNGSGFVYFDPNGGVTSPQTTTQTDYNLRGSTRSRLVAYYQGITYYGGCFGISDPDAHYIQGTFNGYSEASSAATTNTTAVNTGGSSIGSSLTSNIIANGKAYLVNGNFEGKITQTAPILRFKCKGEIAFLSSNGADSINTLAYSAYSGLINAIISFVGNSTVSGNLNDFGAIFTSAQTAINKALSDLQTNFLSAGGVDNALKDAKVLNLVVIGSRRYL